MIITDKRRLRDIQEEFNNKFPYLKLEFYSGTHEEKEGSPESFHLDAEKTIGEVRKINVSGELSINGQQKVSTLENNFQELYGLNVQVFRRSGDLWLQTTRTDSWSLTEQNERGKSETEFRAEPPGTLTKDDIE